MPFKTVLVGAEYEENLSLRYLAATLASAGMDASLVAFDRAIDVAQVSRQVLAEKPDMVGLSIAFQHRVRDFFKLAWLLRQGGFGGHITCGGHLPTIIHDRILSGCSALDSVVRHDGEETLCELARAVEAGKPLDGMLGLTYRRGDELVTNPPRRQPDDLDALPFPDRRGPVHSYLQVPFTTLVGSRGCYQRCAFCCIHAWHQSSEGKRLRWRTPENIAQEMAELYSKRGIRIFCFHDDNFFLARPQDTVRRFEALAAALESHGVRDIALMAKCRPDNLTDEVCAVAVRALGLFRVYIGIENGSEAGLVNLNRRTTVEQNHEALELLRKHGVYACYNLLMFEPLTTMDDVAQNIGFMARHPYFPYNFGRTEVYCGTPLEAQLRARGRLEGSYLSYGYEIEDQRTELLYRVCAIAFQKRNFGPEALANANVHLGFELSIMRRLFDKVPPELLDRGQELMERVNYDTLCFLQEAYRYAEKADLAAGRRTTDFTVDLAYRVNTQDHFLKEEMRDFRRQLAYHAAVRNGEVNGA